MEVEVIFEDNEILVVNKPVGMVSNKAETVRVPTIQGFMEERISSDRVSGEGVSRESVEYFKERSGLVHRLDKETSGLMVLAKTPRSFEALLTSFRERLVHKEYLALTHGIWKADRGTISLPIGRQRHNRKMMGVREDGRESSTSWEVLARYNGTKFPPELKVNTRGYTGFSLVSFMPLTGRMHQIRVHAKHLGHPLVGDVLYAGRKRAREDRKWVGRVMLHAYRLSFPHPGSGKQVEFRSEADFAHELTYLESIE